MVLSTEILLLAVCSGLIFTVHGFEFEDAHTRGVTLGAEEGDIRQVYVDEDNDPGRVQLLLIAGVEGTLSATIYNGEDILGLEMTPTGPNEYVVEINTIDYESLTANQESFPVEFRDDTERKLLNIWINNLDDEPPTFSTTSCNMLEKTTITVDNTSCIFTITDPDGFLSRMDFSDIDGTEGEEDIFLFTYKYIPADNVHIYPVFLILQEGVLLDYEQRKLYNFSIKVKDGAGHATVPTASTPVIVNVEEKENTPPL